MANGAFEAISSLVQAAKRRARGYRTTRSLVAIGSPRRRLRVVSARFYEAVCDQAGVQDS